jgi:hypothetical protein
VNDEVGDDQGPAGAVQQHDRVSPGAHVEVVELVGGHHPARLAERGQGGRVNRERRVHEQPAVELERGPSGADLQPEEALGCFGDVHAGGEGPQGNSLEGGRPAHRQGAAADYRVATIGGRFGLGFPLSLILVLQL